MTGSGRLNHLSVPRLGLIADDLTGACDTGAPFAVRGLRTLVLLAGGGDFDAPADLLVVSTDSRDDSPEVAGRKVRQACLALERRGASLFYKKLDSTLKGNLGPEIDAALAGGGHPFALVAPAFPAMGRTLVDGRLHVHAVDTGDDLRARLSGRATVVDASTDADLAQIARAAWAKRPRPLLVGSSGLARCLAAQMGRAPTAGQRGAYPVALPVAVVIGSENPVTDAQVARLVADGAPETVQHPVVRVSWSDPHRLSGLLMHLGEGNFHGLICSGGDTAALVCSLLETQAIYLEGEIQTGLPWGRLVGGRAPGLPIATKAGGFGGDDALCAAVDFLARVPTEKRSR